jgi:hypothetical protein
MEFGSYEETKCKMHAGGAKELVNLTAAGVTVCVAGAIVYGILDLSDRHRTCQVGITQPFLE